MIEKVNPKHPDKIADRIAGAIVDIAYKEKKDPKIAVEVLTGHQNCFITIESNLDFGDPKTGKETKLTKKVFDAVHRITENQPLNITIVPVKQDTHLANNQKHGVKCGDNGIFKGKPLTQEEKNMSKIAHEIYERYPYDGKYITDQKRKKLIICQSNAKTEDIKAMFNGSYTIIVNPLGDWTGGIEVDSGATNRKLGSDMAQSVTGGGLHGKDLSKADVSVNIYAFLKAQRIGRPVKLCCAIGDDTIDGKPYSEIVEIARDFIKAKGGFEKFAEWGLF